MDDLLTGLSSKATQHLLAELSEQFESRHAVPLRFQSAGGVDIARRVRAGEHADLLVLADDSMQALQVDGLLAAETLRPLFVSQVVLAVPEAMPDPPLATELDLLAVLGTARSVAYSTGPSGTALLQWLADRDPSRVIRNRLVQAPPGTPVATLLADGTAEVGIQQRSELNRAPGVRIVGTLPGDAAITSTFSGALLSTSRNRGATTALAFLGSPEVWQRVEAHGMRPALE